ncbi:hypothetical protein CVT24_009455 [Panaeolus cyanescens]|uniref:Uncharacterized protein n=1 Tax=Panaeolus cyanescens TaxID=181874 RepID=A0A409WCH8_9AGAR|nr:hypothetical protein CVT24_009455 [Panaeolus cyanescens]
MNDASIPQLKGKEDAPVIKHLEERPQSGRPSKVQYRVLAQHYEPSKHDQTTTHSHSQPYRTIQPPSSPSSIATTFSASSIPPTAIQPETATPASSIPSSPSTLTSLSGPFRNMSVNSRNINSPSVYTNEPISNAPVLWPPHAPMPPPPQLYECLMINPATGAQEVQYVYGVMVPTSTALRLKNRLATARRSTLPKSLTTASRDLAVERGVGEGDGDGGSGSGSGGHGIRVRDGRIKKPVKKPLVSVRKPRSVEESAVVPQDGPVEVAHSLEEHERDVQPEQSTREMCASTTQVSTNGDKELEQGVEDDEDSDQEPDEPLPLAGNVYIRCEWPRSDGKPCKKMLWVHLPKDGSEIRNSAIRHHLVNCKYHEDVAWGGHEAQCRFGGVCEKAGSFTRRGGGRLQMGFVDRHVMHTLAHRGRWMVYELREGVDGFGTLEWRFVKVPLDVAAVENKDYMDELVRKHAAATNILYNTESRVVTEY